ncbi:MAG: hypothetical protein F4Z57_22815 [Gemmatimonadetes bacterium]|nr:hypothetical protein [Gemmatimonadota bacterium]MYC70635.1 hypothetical protein [Gemmatimonadota bacterium]MYI62432.1 hypothetical protein [Gemmatimonadota bacterium]
MSRYLKRQAAELEEHDISKELFLGIMMLMLSLGIMILNATQPVWRVHRHDPQPGDRVVLYTSAGMGLSRDGYTIDSPLSEWDFRRMVRRLAAEPEANLHLFLKGGSRERLAKHASFADSLLSTDQAGEKVRSAVYVHTW